MQNSEPMQTNPTMSREERVARAITLAAIQRIHGICPPDWHKELLRMVDVVWQENTDLASAAIEALTPTAPDEQLVEKVAAEVKKYGLSFHATSKEAAHAIIALIQPPQAGEGIVEKVALLHQSIGAAHACISGLGGNCELTHQHPEKANDLDWADRHISEALNIIERFSREEINQ